MAVARSCSRRRRRRRRGSSRRGSRCRGGERCGGCGGWISRMTRISAACFSCTPGPPLGAVARPRARPRAWPAPQALHLWTPRRPAPPLCPTRARAAHAARNPTPPAAHTHQQHVLNALQRGSGCVYRYLIAVNPRISLIPSLSFSLSQSDLCLSSLSLPPPRAPPSVAREEAALVRWRLPTLSRDCLPLALPSPPQPSTQPSMLSISHRHYDADDDLKN